MSKPGSTDQAGRTSRGVLRKIFDSSTVVATAAGAFAFLENAAFATYGPSLKISAIFVVVSLGIGALLAYWSYRPRKNKGR